MKSARYINETRCSKDIPGDGGNYKWPVRFDETEGYVGITQTNDSRMEGGDPPERVLLSPAQVKALLKFLGATREGANDDA